ncbi:VWA domain-containing protein [Thiomicrorhabdus sediminis]|uniref:VWA domain-containing protein n=1 Tax=Thiomicrorhabdus sediminis TaxID=2580412 RepID=A0A4P9K2X5_9GAMM|nr:VWA domain-containing protein [Thiomicrorhabdus sediminis]QCU89202.1 VWA domain-containing protein [Thiomicrorhabdus sediminis]
MDLLQALIDGQLQWRQSLWLWALALPGLWWLLQKLLRQHQQVSYADKSLWPWVMADNSAAPLKAQTNTFGRNVIRLLFNGASPLKLLTIAWLLLVIAMAGPRLLDERYTEQSRQGVDILVSLDVSRSMLAEDVQPNRFLMAKSLLQSLSQQLQADDRIGLSIFAAKPHLVLPPTFDKKVFNHATDLVSPGMLPTMGSDLQLALIHDIHRLQQTSSAAKVLLVFTDGAPLFWKPQPLPEAYAKLAAARSQAFADTGVKVIYIGVGSKQPALIPDAEDNSGSLHVNGLLVQTRLEQKQLMKLAEKVQGDYRLASTSPQFIQALLDDIKQVASSQTTTTSQTYWQDYGHGFLIAAVLFLLAAFYLRSLSAGLMQITKRLVKGKTTESGANSLLTVLLLSGFGATAITYSEPSFAAPEEEQALLNEAYQAFESQAYEQSQSLYDRVTNFDGWFGAGAAAYKNADMEAAVIYFRQAAWQAPNDSLRAQALYNLGNSYYQANLLELAIESFQQALVYQSPYVKAKHNLELAQRRYQLEIAVKKQQQSDDGEEQDGSGKKDNQGAFYGGQKPSNDSTNDGLGADDIDGATGAKDYVLPQAQTVTELGLTAKRNQLQLNANAANSSNAVWQAQHNQRRAEKLEAQLQQLKDDQQALLIRLFEREEGFEATQDKAHPVPGVQPW